MSGISMDLATTLRERGLFFQHTGSSLEEVTLEKRVLYLGFDPTADSLHVGHLAPYMLVRHFVHAGHTAILLVGGGTGMIGDPSFKVAERTLLSEDEVRTNALKITEQVKRILGVEHITVVNNASWLNGLSVISFLREVGKHFTVNAMLHKEMVRERIEDPTKSISFTEFSYPLLQAYDYYYLHTHHGCTLQVGGSDQWGNILAGVEYIRKTTGAAVHGVTTPIITDSSGKKFGKSEGNAVWLDSEKTSPYAFYQYWIGVDDRDAERFARLFTDTPLDEIASLAQEHARLPEKRVIQKHIAYVLTSMVHGEKAAREVAKVSEALFSGTLHTLSSEEYVLATQVAPTYPTMDGTALIEVLVAAGLAQSKRDARTLIGAKAVSLDGAVVADEAQVVTFTNNAPRLLRKGKRDYCLLVRVF